MLPAESIVSLDDVQEARRVLKIEADALVYLSKQLGSEFSKAVDCIYRLSGRLIFTGMGKSGHIANKIASTLASTGTPTFFVHPAEASHGDLGMIIKGDAILALSNSGETAELSDMITYTRRHHIPLIGMTTGTRSTLAKNADIVLLIPQLEEACPLGLAPTTSTTMMLALGDALATAVLKRRGFSVSDFRSLHPGGRLGQRLMKVEQLMHKDDNIPLVSLGTSMKNALLIMTSRGFGCVGVVNSHSELIGIITDGDIRRHLENELLSTSVDSVMTENPRMIVKNMLAQEALARMNQYQITSFFVKDSEESTKPIGILHVHDCLRAGLG
jgi:arabinose-5-phosphate isomerase